MRTIKSERLKKYESDLNDLEQWLKLGLVPKKDIEKHKNEIEAVRLKIEEEKNRLLQLKESGETEEYATPKRVPTRSAYGDGPSIPDIDVADTMIESETSSESEAEGSEYEGSMEEYEGTTKEEDDGEERTKEDSDDEDESYFSDRNRWKRGGIIDPDANEW